MLHSPICLWGCAELVKGATADKNIGRLLLQGSRNSRPGAKERQGATGGMEGAHCHGNIACYQTLSWVVSVVVFFFFFRSLKLESGNFGFDKRCRRVTLVFMTYIAVSYSSH